MCNSRPRSKGSHRSSVHASKLLGRYQTFDLPSTSARDAAPWRLPPIGNHQRYTSTGEQHEYRHRTLWRDIFVVCVEYPLCDACSRPGLGTSERLRRRGRPSESTGMQMVSHPSTMGILPMPCPMTWTRLSSGAPDGRTRRGFSYSPVSPYAQQTSRLAVSPPPLASANDMDSAATPFATRLRDLFGQLAERVVEFLLGGVCRD
ncbi:hypothetical protein HDK77DRAFT_177587 [Phyllosticta capitalensis]